MQTNVIEISMIFEGEYSISTIVSFVEERNFGIFSNSKLIGLNCTFSPHIEFTNRLKAEDSKVSRI